MAVSRRSYFDVVLRNDTPTAGRGGIYREPGPALTHDKIVSFHGNRSHLFLSWPTRPLGAPLSSPDAGQSISSSVLLGNSTASPSLPPFSDIPQDNVSPVPSLASLSEDDSMEPGDPGPISSIDTPIPSPFASPTYFQFPLKEDRTSSRTFLAMAFDSPTCPIEMECAEFSPLIYGRTEDISFKKLKELDWPSTDQPAASEKKRMLTQDLGSSLPLIAHWDEHVLSASGRVEGQQESPQDMSTIEEPPRYIDILLSRLTGFHD